MTATSRRLSAHIIILIGIMCPLNTVFPAETETPKAPLEVYAVRAITNDRILPDASTVPAAAGRELVVAACRGEYESASFAVGAERDVKGLELHISDLKSETGDCSIPASAIDPYVVKCWYQSGRDIRFRNERILTPELLLKDDALVRVDYEKKHNYLRATDSSGQESYFLISGPDSSNLENISVWDAKELQPVDIAAGTVKQFWLTVQVPENAEPGEYSGEIRLTAEGGVEKEIPLRLRVLPFKLEEPVLRYSIYYRGKLRKDGIGSISSEWKSPEQYEAEMRDMKAHGVLFPTVYQGYDPKLLSLMFQLREKAGLPKGALYTLGIGTGSPTEAEQLAALQDGVRRWVEIAAAHGYGPVYVYGIDEARGERLTAQQKAWEAVKKAGARVFVACYKGTFEVMGERLGLAVLAGKPDREEANKYHRVGSQIFCYANPQVGVEEPETYRRNFGLVLWKGNYDGAMNYAYQHSFGHIWNDFDHDRYRDHVFAYPTDDGVIGTIQWDGFREGVNDVRYLSTLLKMIENARRSYSPRAAEAERWLEQVDPAGDLGVIREKMIEWILKLRNL
jgi:hypothetical protein